MLYDTTIVFWLINPKTRAWAYVSVIVFHVLTGLLFQIGVFPVVMMGATWIFFSPEFHQKILYFLNKILRGGDSDFGFRISDFGKHETQNANLKPSNSRLTFILLSAFFIFQLLFPWRYIFYPNNHYWSEEGYRFGWRVMLMEKAGTATFYVKDSRTGHEGLVDNSEFLCAHQEKQMAMQPDMILQFAHFLKKHYEKQGVADPSVRAEVFVTLNGRPSQLLIDSTLDLTQIKDSWLPKTWILPYEK
jgi:hypothetical protein